MTFARAFGSDPSRWAFDSSLAHALGMAVTYCLKQLSEWLSGGGMALGAPPCHACMLSWALHRVLFSRRTTCMHVC